MPCRFAACMASLATSGRRLARGPRRCRPCGTSAPPPGRRCASQSTSPGFSCEAAVWPRSEQPTAARTPNPRSVKFRPLRTVRPTPSYGRQRTWPGRRPPWKMRSSTSRPDRVVDEGGDDGGPQAEAALEAARHVVFAAALPGLEGTRSVWIRSSPGSRRSITSPRLTRSKRQSDAGLISRVMSLRSPPRGRCAARRARRRYRRGRGGVNAPFSRGAWRPRRSRSGSAAGQPRRRRRARARARRRRSPAGEATSGADGSSSRGRPRRGSGSRGR